MSRRHALVIGIDNYPRFGPESQLAGAVRDAEAMATLLNDKYGFAPDDVILLDDGLIELEVVEVSHEDEAVHGRGDGGRGVCDRAKSVEGNHDASALAVDVERT